MTKEQEYTPFGEEWRKETKRIPKDGIIDILENVCVENLKLRNVSLNPTALDLIAAEREKQISKGYTVEHDLAYVEETGVGYDEIAIRLMQHGECPPNWDKDYWNRLCDLPRIDRGRIAATWMARELERLLHLENRKMIYYIDTYYDDIGELVGILADFDDGPEGQYELELNFSDGITAQHCKEIPLLDVTKDRIFSALWDAVNEDNWPEDSDRTEHELEKALNSFVDAISAQIEALKKAMPTVWMATKETTHYSLEELLKLL